MPIRPLTAMTALLALSGSALAADELPPPTARDAEAFIAKVEAELLPLNEYANRVAWIGNTFITDDTLWLQAKVRAERTRFNVANAKQAATFDGVAVDPITRRKLDALKQHLSFMCCSEF